MEGRADRPRHAAAPTCPPTRSAGRRAGASLGPMSGSRSRASPMPSEQRLGLLQPLDGLVVGAAIARRVERERRQRASAPGVRRAPVDALDGHALPRELVREEVDAGAGEPPGGRSSSGQPHRLPPGSGGREPAACGVAAGDDRAGRAQTLGLGGEPLRVARGAAERRRSPCVAGRRSSARRSPAPARRPGRGGRRSPSTTSSSSTPTPAGLRCSSSRSSAQRRVDHRVRAGPRVKRRRRSRSARDSTSPAGLDEDRRRLVAQRPAAEEPADSRRAWAVRTVARLRRKLGAGVRRGELRPHPRASRAARARRDSNPGKRARGLAAPRAPPRRRARRPPGPGTSRSTAITSVSGSSASSSMPRSVISPPTRALQVAPAGADRLRDPDARPRRAGS